MDTYVPLAKNDEAVVTQYTMTTLEELGLLKMDFLALRNLTVLDDAIQMVRTHTPDFDLRTIPDDDPQTFQMLSDGRTCGVFQMESAGMTGVCVGLKPKDIEDITAIIALYRPGPMDSIPRFIASKHDPASVRYKHPSLEPILSNTYGCIVYQEQVIEIFRRLAGYSLGQADMVRRAMSKKKLKDIQREREAFLHGDPERNIAGCAANGIPQETAESIYDEITDFANYAFNKAHAVCYAIVAYQTAWFKCHYPREYMAALLTSVLDSQDKIAEYIAECRSLGIRLLPPDVNESGSDFTVAGQDIRFGLAALKGVGRGFTKSILTCRETDGPFVSFLDFCKRMLEQDMNKRMLESLIRAGGFDSMGLRRSQLLDAYEQLLDSLTRNKRKNLEGQFDLFSQTEDGSEPTVELVLRDIPEFSPQELMTMEKEVTDSISPATPWTPTGSWPGTTARSPSQASWRTSPSRTAPPASRTASASTWPGSSPRPRRRRPRTTPSWPTLRWRTTPARWSCWPSPACWRRAGTTCRSTCPSWSTAASPSGMKRPPSSCATG